MQNTELRRRARPVLDALRTLALQGRTPVLGLRKKSCPYHSWDTVQEDPATAPGWTPFAPGDAIGGVEAHYCFRGGITAPAGSAVMNGSSRSTCCAAQIFAKASLSTKRRMHTASSFSAISGAVSCTAT